MYFNLAPKDFKETLTKMYAIQLIKCNSINDKKEENNL